MANVRNSFEMNKVLCLIPSLYIGGACGCPQRVDKVAFTYIKDQHGMTSRQWAEAGEMRLISGGHTQDTASLCDLLFPSVKNIERLG